MFREFREFAIRGNVVDLVEHSMQGPTPTDDVAKRRRLFDFFSQIRIVRLELLLQSFKFRKSTGVRDRRCGLIGEHPEPPEFLVIDRLSAKHREDAQRFFAEDQGLSNEADDAFTSHPIWASPLLRPRIRNQQSGAVRGNRPHLEMR